MASLPATGAGQPPALGTLEEEIAGLRVLLRGETTPQLADRVAAARSRWPHDLQLMLFEGALFEKAGRLEESEACFRRALAEHPGNPWPGVRLMELLLRQQRREEAARAFKAAVWPAALPDDLRGQLLSRICTAFADLSQRRDFLHRLLQGAAADRFLLLKLAALSFRQHNRSEAQRLFDAAGKLGEPAARTRAAHHGEPLRGSVRACDGIAGTPPGAVRFRAPGDPGGAFFRPHRGDGRAAAPGIGALAR
jgi:tetratricopeptide (TPR) repeat protein